MGTQTVFTCDRKSCGKSITVNDGEHASDNGFRYDCGRKISLIFCDGCYQLLEALKEKHENDFKVLFEEFMK